jgi:transglutaminase-like putative cysteine protease
MGARLRTLSLELAAFAALASFAALHWAALVAEPPTGRVLGCLAIALVTGLALAATAPLRPAWLAQSLRGALAVAGLAGGLAAMGVEPRLLAPGGWEELAARLEIGLQGSSQLDLPYAGEEEWTRLGILLAIPLALGLAAPLAFWPARRRELLRTGALVVLVGLYGFAVTWEGPSRELQRGFVLLLAIAAWIWLPRLEPRWALPGFAVVLAAGLVALPLASRVEAARPLVDYKQWSLFGASRDVGFGWNHTYGPLDWPQRGTTVLQVGADRPMYWKTTVLETFNGRTWTTSPSLTIEGETREPPSRVTGAGSRIVRRNSRWLEPIRFAVRGLTSDLLVSAGTTLQVQGVDLAAPTPSGTFLPTALPLRGGDTYSVLAYVPDPTASELRATEPVYPRGLERYTAFLVPSTEAGGPHVVRVPPGDRSSRTARRVHRQLEGGVYEQVHELAVSLVAGQSSTYDAVAAIERHLKDEYEYEQNVPAHPDPLPAFLFEDRAGYCQHFAGAMALMLRMVGIPARVVAGFAPGVQGKDDQRVYTVRDLDAHSWVEVWFPRIGWVTFDPTPSSSPAENVETTIADASPAPAGGGSDERSLSLTESERGQSRAVPRATVEDENGDGGSALPLIILGLGCGYGALIWARRRRMLGSGGAEVQIRELERALERLGWELPPGGTLLVIEERLRERAGPAAARYAQRLREHRYRAGRPSPPGPGERGALRRALRRGGGPVRWWRVLRALPPGGPALRG